MSCVSLYQANIFTHRLAQLDMTGPLLLDVIHKNKMVKTTWNKMFVLVYFFNSVRLDSVISLRTRINTQLMTDIY